MCVFRAHFQVSSNKANGGAGFLAILLQYPRRFIRTDGHTVIVYGTLSSAALLHFSHVTNNLMQNSNNKMADIGGMS